jgi:predicted nucleotidyltransferase
MPDPTTRATSPPTPERKTRAPRGGISADRLERELAVAIGSLVRWPGVRRIWLFGSAAVGGPWDWRSDLDFAVEGMAVTDQARAWAELDEALSPPVDLIRWEAANPVLRDQIRQRGRLIYEG